MTVRLPEDETTTQVRGHKRVLETKEIIYESLPECVIGVIYIGQVLGPIGHGASEILAVT